MIIPSTNVSSMSFSPDPVPEDQSEGVLDGIRSACARVAENASLVKIVRTRIAGYLEILDAAGGIDLEMDPAIHFQGEEEETIAFFLTLDSVNFGSGYFPEILPDPRLSGFRTIASELTGHFRTHGPFTAEALSALTPLDCARLFRFDPLRPPVSALMALYAQALNDLGRFVLSRFEGSFARVIEAANGSAERLASLLALMPLFRDIAFYRGDIVPFYKRAQIAAADLFISFGGEGPGRFRDVERLTLFADNLVPHVLRHDGLLHYDDTLAARIDRGELLAPGSAAEVEIRACAVHVVELLVQEAHRRHQPLNALQLDNRLWHRGQQPQFRSLPRHRTLTPFY